MTKKKNKNNQKKNTSSNDNSNETHHSNSNETQTTTSAATDVATTNANTFASNSTHQRSKSKIAHEPKQTTNTKSKSPTNTDSTFNVTNTQAAETTGTTNDITYKVQTNSNTTNSEFPSTANFDTNNSIAKDKASVKTSIVLPPSMSNGQSSPDTENIIRIEPLYPQKRETSSSAAVTTASKQSNKSNTVTRHQDDQLNGLPTKQASNAPKQNPEKTGIKKSTFATPANPSEVSSKRSNTTSASATDASSAAAAAADAASSSRVKSPEKLNPAAVKKMIVDHIKTRSKHKQPTIDTTKDASLLAQTQTIDNVDLIKDESRWFRALKEACAGAGGTIFSALLVFPIDLIKTRRILNSIESPHQPSTSMLQTAKLIFENEGFLALYTGLSSELIKGCLQNFLYFASYDILKDFATQKLVQRKLLNNAPSLIEQSPLSRHSSHNLSHDHHQSAFSQCYYQTSNSSKSIYHDFYKHKEQDTHLRPPDTSVSTVTESEKDEKLKSLQFTTQQAKIEAVGELSMGIHLLIGIFAGCITQIFVNPVSVIQTRSIQQQSFATKLALEQANLQSKTIKNVSTQNLLKKHQIYVATPSILSVTRNIYRNEGFGPFFDGLLPAFILTSNPAIQFFVFDKLKFLLLQFLLHRKLSSTSKIGDDQQEFRTCISAGESFVIGAIAKICATLITYPYIMAKIRLQWRDPLNPNKLRYQGTRDVIQQIIKQDGFQGLYTGIKAQMLKSVLGAALMFMAKEQLQLLSRKIIEMLLDYRQNQKLQ